MSVSAASSDPVAEFVGAEVHVLRRIALAWCRDLDAADDAVQDALVKVVQEWPKVAAANDPGAYARTILINVLRRTRPRDRTRRAELHEHVEDTTTRAAMDDDTIAQRLVLTEALDGLTSKQRAVMVLRYYEDRSVDQVAEIMGTSPGNIKRQASRARDHLRHALGPLAAYGASSAAFDETKWSET